MKVVMRFGVIFHEKKSVKAMYAIYAIVYTCLTVFVILKIIFIRLDL